MSRHVTLDYVMSRCGGKFAPFFCANVTCLQYYCEQCWASIHSRPGREFHKPLVKEGADRYGRYCGGDTIGILANYKYMAG